MMKDVLHTAEQLGLEIAGKSGSEVVCLCPHPDCDDSSGHFHWNNQKGVGNCKLCEFSPNTTSLLEVLLANLAEELPEERLKALAEDRELPVQVFNDLGVCEADDWFVLPVFGANGRLASIRRYQPGLGIQYFPGCPASLYGLEKLRETPSTAPLYLCEGEWDAIALRYLAAKAGVPAVVLGVPGANVFKDFWRSNFIGRDIYIAYDNDDAGRKGIEKVVSMLAPVAKSLHELVWPKDFPEKYDVRDWVVEQLNDDGGYSLSKGAKVDSNLAWQHFDALFEMLETPQSAFVSSPIKVSRQKQWPSPLSPEAKRGVLGNYLELVMPTTEADEAAIVAQFLTCFGNMIGRSAYFEVEQEQHFMKLFTLVIGQSSRGRKGTSWSRIKALFEAVDPDWYSAAYNSGLSSGEGLIELVRDAEFQTENAGTEEQTIRRVRGGNTIALIVEGEFASVLKNMRRDTNTLSAQLRSAWDDTRLQTATRNRPLRAENSHISVIAHITAEELKRLFTDTDAANGFGNRFLWICARRSKVLPHPPKLNAVEMQRLTTRLRAVVERAKKMRRMTRTAEANEYWTTLYGKLTEEREGMYGSLTSRAEAQAVRLSCIYALLDGSSSVKTAHLRAAEAVLNYALDSVGYLFGDTLGDPVADCILANLNEKAEGITRGQLHGLFGNKKTADQLDNALERLSKRNLAYCVRETSAGRTAERWFAVRAE